VGSGESPAARKMLQKKQCVPDDKSCPCGEYLYTGTYQGGCGPVSRRSGKTAMLRFQLAAVLWLSQRSMSSTAHSQSLAPNPSRAFPPAPRRCSALARAAQREPSTRLAP
jgi:hypothetical protein